MKLLVCGGRDFFDKKTAFATLDLIHSQTPISEIIEGGAKGADELAMMWAQESGIQVQTVRANWRLHGRKAGPLRNAQMLLLKPDRVLAMPGGKGTANMVKQARDAGIPVTEIMS